ncbi:MAG TPA: bifunctional diaminohydroxyphosphoribosylaminopyrimidine deaminase/5-amino-6-(5-phosphoribosylamino)uracil reductase RibD [Alcanivoracaceae bacterium]|nr:bifunctional diaminohydroxyphosphoribosylaminopyrimidine deaminase/5-amino-6-(5-phosphoribosylamino)uracil reductase RibD [Alcanivoracaceae bacterium]
MSDVSSTDRHYMARAIQLARRGTFTTSPNPNVGAVIVRHGQVLGEGWHQQAGGPHAERWALQAAGEAAQGATCYVTLEPCSHQGRTGPCADALIEAGVQRVVVAMRDPNPQVAGTGLQRLQAAGITVHQGVLEQEARALNPGFIKRMEQGLPWVRLKLAMSVDGRTAMASGESQWITGAAAREDVQQWRARSCVMLTGVGTVLYDNASLTVRPEQWQRHPAYPLATVRQPVRVVLDRRWRTPETANIITQPGSCWVLGEAAHFTAAKGEALEQAGAHWKTMSTDPMSVLAWLAEQGHNEVLLECGAELAGAFVAAGAVDEIITYMAPIFMGSSARPLLALPGIESMAEVQPLALTDARRFGADWRFMWRLTDERSGNDAV